MGAFKADIEILMTGWESTSDKYPLTVTKTGYWGHATLITAYFYPFRFKASVSLRRSNR